MDFDRILLLLSALADNDVEYVVVGGVALNLHGIVRATEDLDLFVRDDEKNIARLRTALNAVWNDPATEEIRAEDLAGDYPVIRYGPPGENFAIDVMSRLGEAVVFIDVAWELVNVEGVSVRVATPAALYAMKKATVRPIDKADAAALREMFQLEGS